MLFLLSDRRADVKVRSSGRECSDDGKEILKEKRICSLCAIQIMRGSVRRRVS